MTLGFAQVEERLRRIRSRRNLIALRGALLVAAGNVVLFAALLVAVARRAESWFGIALWVGVAVVAAHAAFAALRLQRTWMPLDRLARWVDSAAHLDDRLATLSAGPSRLEGSRFAPLLLSQTLSLSSRWEPQALIPRTFPRAAIFLGISLVSLLLTFLLISPSDPAADGEGPHLSAKLHQPQPPKEPEAQPEEGSAGADGSPSAGTGARAFQASGFSPEGRPGGRQEGIRASAHGAFPGQPSGQRAAPDSQAEKLPGLDHASGDANGDPAEDGRDAAHDLASIRVRRDETAAAGEQSQKASLKLTDAAKRDAAHPPAENGEGAEGQGNPRQPDPRHPGDRNDENASSEERSGKEQTAGAAGGARAARDGGGQGDGDVLGKKGVPQTVEGHPETFSLRLSAVMSNAPTEFEPQKRKPVPATAAGERPGADPAYSEVQSPDDPLHKTEVEPEYEGILRRVFDRR